MFNSTNGGGSWIRKGPKESGLKVKFHPTNPDTLLCGTFTGGLYKSENGGDSWSNLRANVRITEIAYNPAFPNEILVSEINQISPPFYQQLLKSENGGINFSVVADLAPSQIIYIPNSDSVIASVNTAQAFSGLYLSTARGNIDTWVPYALIGDQVKTAKYYNGSVYAGLENGQLYKVNSSGTQNITGDWIQPTEITNIYFLNNELYVGMNGAEHDRDVATANHGGVWYSRDGGQSWSDISEGLTCTQLFSNNVMTELDGKLLVATYGGSFFTLDVLPVGFNTTITERTELQIYPNPFTDKITVTIPKAINCDKIHYKIIDIQGRVIQIGKIPYQQRITLDLSKLSNGVYLFKLIVNKKTFTQKIMLTNLPN